MCFIFLDRVVMWLFLSFVISYGIEFTLTKFRSLLSFHIEKIILLCMLLANDLYPRMLDCKFNDSLVKLMLSGGLKRKNYYFERVHFHLSDHHW